VSAAEDFEFYETAEPFTRWLNQWTAEHGWPIEGDILEPCCGARAIPRALVRPNQRWFLNDLDPRWSAAQKDATQPAAWLPWTPLDWTVTNPPFTQAVPILAHALAHSRVGVAMYLRLSIHEPLKTGERRSFFADHKPTAVLVLPRFAHQRSKKTGAWTTDSMTSCWCVWIRGESRQFIDYAPESVIDELDAFTPAYRDRMDALMGYTGDESQRQEQRRAA
jgi:hypothetical protein